MEFHMDIEERLETLEAGLQTLTAKDDIWQLIARYARAVDEERYFRVPADNRDLNYKKYFVEGEVEIASLDDYTSHNTERLDVAGVKKLISTLDLTQDGSHD